MIAYMQKRLQVKLEAFLIFKLYGFKPAEYYLIPAYHFRSVQWKLLSYYLPNALRLMYRELTICYRRGATTSLMLPDAVWPDGYLLCAAAFPGLAHYRRSAGTTE